MTNDPLTQTEIERYGRHILLPEIGGAGQQRLKNAAVLVAFDGEPRTFDLEELH